MKKTKKSGRKTTKTGKQSTIADSIGQAGSMLGLPVRLLQKAKSAGCPGFKNGRICLDVVRTWLADPENADKLKLAATDLEKVELDIAREKLRIIRHKANLAEGTVLPKDAVRLTMVRLVTGAKQRLLLVPTSAAKLLVGQDEATIVEELRRQIYAALTDLSRHPWNKPETPAAPAAPDPAPAERAPDPTGTHPEAK